MRHKRAVSRGRQGLILGRSGRLLGAAAALSVVLTWISMTSFPAMPRQNDSVDYYSMANYLAGTGGSPSLFVPPGYPLFLNLARHFGKPHYGDLLVLFQHLLRLAPFLVFCFLARLQPGSLVPGFAALVWVMAPETYVFSHYVMSEAPAVGVTALGVAAMLWLWLRPGFGPAAVAGLLAAVLTLIRPAGPVILAAGIVGLWLGAKRLTARLRTEIGACFVAAWLLGLTPWLLHNFLLEGSFSLVSSTGRHLFNRVVVEQGLIRKDDEGLAYLEKIRANPKSTGPTYWWNYHWKLLHAGLSEVESDRIMKEAALRGIVSHPVGYIAGTLSGAGYIAWWTPLPPSGSTFVRVVEYDLKLPVTADREQIIRTCNIVPTRDAKMLLDDLSPEFTDSWRSRFMSVWIVAWFFLGFILHALIIALVLLGLSVMLLFPGWKLNLDRDISKVWARPLGAFVLLWLLGHAATEIPVPRYGLPVQPFVILALILGGKALWGLRSRLARRMER